MIKISQYIRHSEWTMFQIVSYKDRLILPKNGLSEYYPTSNIKHGAFIDISLYKLCIPLVLYYSGLFPRIQTLSGESTLSLIVMKINI
jgi:hypothetical protein